MAQPRILVIAQDLPISGASSLAMDLRACLRVNSLFGLTRYVEESDALYNKVLADWSSVPTRW